MKKKPRATPTVRIIGGNWRGRLLRYSGDPRTRPMKDRTREAIFNLVGPATRGKLAIDFFAGTGALAFESLSRGAERAVCIERHFPSARLIAENAATLEASDLVQIATTDAFLWARLSLPQIAAETPCLPWLLFVSPPYDFFVDRAAEMAELIEQSIRLAPSQSILVVESDRRFCVDSLPDGRWDVRSYAPAQVAILEVET